MTVPVFVFRYRDYVQQEHPWLASDWINLFRGLNLTLWKKWFSFKLEYEWNLSSASHITKHFKSCKSSILSCTSVGMILSLHTHFDHAPLLAKAIAPQPITAIHSRTQLVRKWVEFFYTSFCSESQEFHSTDYHTIIIKLRVWLPVRPPLLTRVFLVTLRRQTNSESYLWTLTHS